MSTTVINLLNDKVYLQRYYPTDMAIRNKGKLTLITPPFISDLSALKMSSRNIKLNIHSNNIEIPDKDEVLELIQSDCQKSDRDIISRLVDISATRVNNSCLARNDRELLFWDLINRILNAKIGSLVYKVRSSSIEYKYSIEAEFERSSFLTKK